MTGILNILAGSIASAIKDGYFNLVTLLLPGNGTNGAQNNTFLDSSTNNFTITRNGNTTQGTFSPFSQTGWSNYLASSGRLAFGVNSAFDITQGDFTVEAWVNISSYSAAQHIAWYRNDSPASGWAFRISITTGYLQIFYTGGSIVTSTSAVPLNSWVHVAACRSGGTCYLFINGTQVGSAAFSNGTTQTTFGFRVGADSGGTENLIGYISNFRLVKSGALYTSSFTPSTTPLTTTVSAGTVSLLTCQSNRFVDNSSNAFAITLEGTTTSVQAFSPFAPTAAYSAATNGGSGYFDGTGDYLSVADSAEFNLGTNDWTIESWFYATAYSVDYPRLWGQSTGGGTGNNSVGLFFQTQGDGSTIVLRYGTTTNQTNDVIITINATKNQWHHIAVVRDGNTMRLYFNGVQKSTTTVTGVTFYNSTAAFAIGANSSGGELWQGYISDVRLVNGTCLYTGGTTFTPPTAPLTAVTNTKLLTSFTNAGITDATAKNDLETVGNAQISTTQSKFGGSSMYFDGTGDYAVSPASPLHNIFQGDFTIECYVYFSSVANTPHIWNIGTGTNNRAALYLNASKVTFYTDTSAGTGANRITGTTTINTGQWYYVALTKSGTTFTLYVDGASQGTSTTTAYPNADNRVALGFNNFGSASGDYLNGYIDDFRITRGYVRTVTSTPTAAFPVQ